MRTKVKETFYIYMFKNTVNGKIYIGKTKNPKKRKHEHFWTSEHPERKDHCYIHKAIKKYGKHNFEFVVIDSCDNEFIVYELEKQYIEHFNSNDRDIGYNISEGGLGGSGSPTLKEDLNDEFPNSYTVNKETDCWEWTGIVDKKGIPIMNYMDRTENAHGSKQFYARHFALNLIGKPIPPRGSGTQTRCENRLCVNPEHIIAGDEERFWSKVEKTNTCWLWIGAKDKDDYGKFTRREKGKSSDIRAHRYSYELHFGEVEPGLCVGINCGNHCCVNPDHLIVQTISANASKANGLRKGISHKAQ